LAAISSAVIHVCGYPSRFAAAETCRAELDALHVQLQFGTLTVTRAAELLAKQVARVPLVDDTEIAVPRVSSRTLAA
jgi:hypothetical protein